MNFSPKLIFWVTFSAWVGQGFASGAVHLTNMIPDRFIPPTIGWIAFLTWVALGFLSAATGYAGIGKGPLAGSPTTQEADSVKAQAVAAVVKKSQ